MTTVDAMETLTAVAVVGTTIVAATVGALLLYYKRYEKEPLQRPRSWSFTSTGLALGSFPPSVKNPEPIVNSVLFFNDCPTPEDVIEKIVPRLLQYERLAIIPEPEKRTSRHCNSNLDHSMLVRQFIVNGDKQLTMNTIKDHLFDSLVENREDLPWWEILIIEARSFIGLIHSFVLLISVPNHFRCFLMV